MNRSLGWLFLIIGLFGVYANLSNGTPQYLLWFCNHSAFIIGLALIYNSREWLTAQVSLGLFPQLVWSLDFLSKLLTGNYLFNITAYMFEPNYPLALYIMSLNHLIMTPIVLVILWKSKPVMAWRQSLAHLIMLIPLSDAHPSFNLNCLLEPCVPFLPDQLYTIYYTPLVLLIAYLTNRFILYLYEHTSSI